MLRPANCEGIGINNLKLDASVCDRASYVVLSRDVTAVEWFDLGGRESPTPSRPLAQRGLEPCLSVE